MNRSGVNLTLKEEKYIDDRAKKGHTKRGWQKRKEKLRDVFRNLDMEEVMKEITILNGVDKVPQFTPTDYQLKTSPSSELRLENNFLLGLNSKLKTFTRY